MKTSISLFLVLFSTSHSIAFGYPLHTSKLAAELSCYKDLDDQVEYSREFQRNVSPIFFNGINNLIVIPFKENQFLFVTDGGIYLQSFPGFSPSDYIWNSSVEVQLNKKTIVNENFKSTKTISFLLDIQETGALRINWSKEKKGNLIRYNLKVEPADFVPKTNPPTTAEQLNRETEEISTNDMLTPETQKFILDDLTKRIRKADSKHYRPLMAGKKIVSIPFQNCLKIPALKSTVESVLKDRLHIDLNTSPSKTSSEEDPKPAQSAD